VALDVALERAVELAERLDGRVDGFKIGYDVVLEAGAEGVREVARAVRESFVLVDLKVADIPEVSRRIVAAVSERGADAVIVHGFVGRDVVRECAREAPVVVVATMSHPGARRFYDPVCREVVRVCEHLDGVVGFVAPATRPAQVRAVRELTDKVIISPGVGAQGAEPGSALEVGADFEIVGRAVTRAEDPERAVEDLVRAMRSSRPTDGDE
jgi:orotidine-5'-phosphate decarboxylase